MLINFRVENYKSYKNLQVFTMIPRKYKSKKNHVISKEKANILKFSSIYGGNASGKSNLVDAIKKTQYMILKGKVLGNTKNLYFKLDENMIDKPSKFEYEILIGEKVFAYGFSIIFSKQLMVNEYLYEIKDNNEKLYFDFDYLNEKMEFYKNVKSHENMVKIGVYIDDFKNKDKKDEFFLTFLNKIKFSEIEEWDKDIKDVYNWFHNILTVVTPKTKLGDIFGLFNEKEKENYIPIIELIKTFDTGITNILKETIGIDEFLVNIKSTLSRDLVEEIIEDVEKLENNTILNLLIDEKYYKIFKEEEKVIAEIIKFEHCNLNSIHFEFNEESDGTKRLIELVNMLYYVQFKSKVYIVDEINRSLHPNLTLDFIEKFIKLSYGNESQLIVTNHESAIMDLSVVRQDEIWVVDRQENGASNLISLSKYSIRSDKVLNKDYLFGRYGGVPQVLKLLNFKGDDNG